MSLCKLEMERFNGTNELNLWRIKMKAWLPHQGFSTAISRQELEVLAERDGVNAKDSMLKVHSSLLLSLGDKVLREVANQESAIKEWEELETLFLKKSFSNRLILMKQLYSPTMSDFKELKNQMDEFNKIILDLRSVDVRIDEDYMAIIMLSYLPKSYESINYTMMYGRVTLNMNEVKAMLNSKENQKKVENKTENVEMLYVRGKSEWNASKLNGKARSDVKGSRRCFLCHREGHLKRDCPRRKWMKHEGRGGGEASIVTENSDEIDPSQVLVVLANQSREEWIMDSGSSYHIFPRKSRFKSFKEWKWNVLLWDKSSCQILGIGNINLRMVDGCILELHNVKYVPDIKSNLISLSTLDENGSQMGIRKGSIIVYKDDIALKLAAKKGGLYVLVHPGFWIACVVVSMKKENS